MEKQTEQNTDRYYDIFPTTLRGLLESHPKDGHSTTYKALGEAVGVRQQTISQYASGQTQPTADVALRIARFFDVSVDYLLTGISACNKGYNEELGLSEEAIGYVNLEFSREDWTKDMNLRVVSIQIVFQATKLDEITKGVIIDEKKSGSKD